MMKRYIMPLSVALLVLSSVIVIIVHIVSNNKHEFKLYIYDHRITYCFVLYDNKELSVFKGEAIYNQDTWKWDKKKREMTKKIDAEVYDNIQSILRGFDQVTYENGDASYIWLLDTYDHTIFLELEDISYICNYTMTDYLLSNTYGEVSPDEYPNTFLLRELADIMIEYYPINNLN